MSLQNLYTHNNEILFCKKLTADNLDFGNVEVDHITVDNVTVLTTINTSNINSGTSLFNTIDTLTINAQTGNMGTINSQNINSLNITTENLSSQTFTTQNETVNNSTINNLTVNNSLTVPTLTSNNIDSTNINISNTASINNLSTNTISTNNITSPLANIDNIISDDLTVNNTATINSLNVNNTFSAPLFEAPDMHVDYVRSYSVGKTTFQENVVVNTQLNCPLIGVDVIQTNGTGNVSVINPLIAPSIQLSTISGTPSTPLNFYYYEGAGIVPVSGAINLLNVGYKATRIGNSVSFQLNSFPTATCTNNSSPLNITLPSILQPVLVTRGIVVILNGALSVVARWNISGGIMTINAGLNPTDFWTLGNICSIAGGTWNFQWVI